MIHGGHFPIQIIIDQRYLTYLYLIEHAWLVCLLLASNSAAEENAAWIQLSRLSQQFPEIWEFVYYLHTQNPRFRGIADSGEKVESRPHFPPRPG